MAPTLPETIKALKTLDKKLSVVDVPFAERDDIKNLRPDDIITKTLAVGLNPVDWLHAIGFLNPPGAFNVAGSDSVGEVVAVGSAVTHIKVGDRVAGFVYGASDANNGAFAEYVRQNKNVCFVLPESMRNIEAAAFPIPHLTAVQTLYLRLRLAPPSAPIATPRTLLIWGGATAVGHHAVQLAKLSGYKVLTTASPANHAALRALGADAVFDYRDPEVVQKIKDAAGTEGVFAALDTAAEAGSTDLTIDAIGAQGGPVIVLLPPSDASKARRADVSVEYTLAYTLLGYGFTYYNDTFTYPALPEDNAAVGAWVADELPALLCGWDTAQGGSPKLKAPKLRVLDGGLDRIHEGLEIMRKGDYKAEKLVYKLA
ncbi:chaperonin 10-like protein [Amylostereum chailletii]|nr:chaperonin 10-like protein [Amylostereum chailletii]